MERVKIDREKTIQEMAYEIIDKFGNTEMGRYKIQLMCDRHAEKYIQKQKHKLIDAIEVGQEVEAHFNLRGRSWTNPQGEVKWFNTIVVWKIDAMAKEMQSTSQKMTIADEVGDSLPF